MSENILKPIERNEFGLVKGIDYKFLPDGTVDWRNMIPQQFLYVNNDIKRRDKLEKKYGKAYDQIDIVKDNVEDSDLVIMLGGIKYLLKIRGFQKVIPETKISTQEYASVSCFITFIPNYETEGREVIYGDNACAHLGNTNSFGQNYLVEMATNRALCRAVRSFLNINIVSKEEILQEDAKPIVSIQKQVKLLSDLMTKKKVRWLHVVDTLKRDDEAKLKELTESGQSDKFIPKWKDTYTGIEVLPSDLILELIERIKKIPQT